MICIKCGYDNPAGVRFCVQCAAELANVCPQCGFENPAGFKFCGNCGANLTAAAWRATPQDDLRRMQNLMPAYLVEKIVRQSAEHRGERRTVTILFCDLSGFTSISERLDPEDVYSIMDRVFERFVEEIYRYEGTVDKFTGDGLLALFGAPVAHENDEERAARAALGMQGVLEEINAELAEKYQVALRLRVGLHTGEVVVGGLGSDLRLDYTVMGDAVNVAARLQQATEPGTILASEDVYRVTEPLFTYRWVGEVALKGRTRPVRAYHLLSEKAERGSVRGLRGQRAPLIGRDRELGLLRDTASTWVTAGRGGVVVLTGDAGMGKSRLTAEFRTHSADLPADVLDVACLAHAHTTGWWTIRSLLRRVFGVEAVQEPTAMASLVEDFLVSLAGNKAGDLLPFVMLLLSPTWAGERFSERIRHLSPEEFRQQTFLALRELFSLLARRRPLLLIIDDLHWIDKLSLDVLLFLMSVSTQAPLIFYAISRPTEGEAAAQIAKQAQYYLPDRFVSVHLSPLSAEDIQRLLDALLASSDLPDSWRRVIVERVEGNPFFLEEFIRMMIDRGILRRQEDGTWVATGQLAGLEGVPRTLRGLILTRVDALGEPARDLLQCASVIGRTFSARLLPGVISWPDLMEQSLRELEERGLVYAEAAQDDDRRFTFYHALTQEAVYDTLLRRRRAALHRAVGFAMEREYADRLDDFVELLAHHFDVGEVPEKALDYALRAGQLAAARYANQDALNHFRRALVFSEMVETVPMQRFAIHAGLADASIFLGEYDAAIEHYEKAMGLLGGLPADRHPFARVDLLRRLARAWERKGDYERAHATLEDALAELPPDASEDTHRERAQVLSDLGWVTFRLGHMETARRRIQEALDMLVDSGELQALSAVYNRLAAISYHSGDWAGAAQYAQQGLALREQIGYTYGLAMSYNNLSVIYMAGGDWEHGIDYAERSLALKREMGDIEGEGISYNNLGMAYKDRGELARAREYLTRSLEIARRLRHANLTCSSLSNLGHVALMEGDWADAVSYLDEALALAVETGSLEQQVEALCLLAESWLAAGDRERAEQCARQARYLAEKCGACHSRALAARAWGVLCAAQGQGLEAIQWLERSLALFEDVRNRLEMGRTRMLLGKTWLALGQEGDAGRALRKALQDLETAGAQGELSEARWLLRNCWDPLGGDEAG